MFENAVMSKNFSKTLEYCVQPTFKKKPTWLKFLHLCKSSLLLMTVLLIIQNFISNVISFRGTKYKQ